MPNEMIHNEIEDWLAADVHDQLSAEERAAFQQHLAACASCQALQEEEKQMHQLLENTLATESADPAFEQRMVSRFRDRIPAPDRGLSSFLAGLMRMRAAADRGRRRAPPHARATGKNGERRGRRAFSTRSVAYCVAALAG